MGELERMTQFKDKSGAASLSEESRKLKEKGIDSLTLEELKHMLATGQAARTIGDYANVGLFAYPVLMAADILLYDSAAVPVGNDQDQHLELTRTIARKFNSRFGQTFVEPKSVITSTPRVMSLDDPMKKMSKSRPAGCLFIDDEPEVIKKKIMSAVTDSGKEVLFSPEAKPGIANLLMITEAITGNPTK
jgi:tryptophanyl-tRNA synthetase